MVEQETVITLFIVTRSVAFCRLRPARENLSRTGKKQWRGPNPGILHPRRREGILHDKTARHIFVSLNVYSCAGDAEKLNTSHHSSTLSLNEEKSCVECINSTSVTFSCECPQFSAGIARPKFMERLIKRMGDPCILTRRHGLVDIPVGGRVLSPLMVVEHQSNHRW